MRYDLALKWLWMAANRDTFMPTEKKSTHITIPLEYMTLGRTPLPWVSTDGKMLHVANVIAIAIKTVLSARWDPGHDLRPQPKAKVVGRGGGWAAR